MLAWVSDLTQRERRTMIACFGGWSLDALDLMIFSFVIPSLIAVLHITSGQAGLLASSTLVASAFGGWFAGALSDRFGRVRVLQFTIIWYATFSLLCGFAQSYEQLFVLRGLQGFGIGGEWATGAVLMGEVIRDKYRGRAVGIVQTGFSFGWAGAAILYTVLFATLPETMAWRALFWAGFAPALLVFWIRRFVAEPELHQRIVGQRPSGGPLVVLQQPFFSTVWRVALMTTGAQGGNAALTLWMPTYLKTVRHLTTIGTGAYLFVLIAGSIVGFVAGAHLSDGVGRKNTFFISLVGTIALIFIFLFAPISESLTLLVAFVLGFFAFIMYAPMGPFMTELFPTAVRGTCQGFCYNFGRGVGAAFPALIGYLAQQMGLGTAIATFSVAAYSLMAVALFLLPETRGRDLASLDSDYERSRR